MSIKNISNQKSVLAKLLAQENITVEHKSIHTAYFDPVNRILGLPIWKEMSSDVYDLLVGHEVGHAWETPPKGWHSAIEEKGSGFKSFLNVVEDARIEKLIKARYPGIGAPMYRGYNELYQKNFFGIDNESVEDLTIIDRLNLHFKIGALHNIPFSEEEMVYVKRMESLKTWDDVYQLASDLYEYQKEESRKQYDDYRFTSKGISLNDDADIDEYDDEEQNDMNGESISNGSAGSEDEPRSITDQCFREKELTLLDDKIKPYFYLNIPKADLSKIIISHNNLYSNTDFSKLDNYNHYVQELIDKGNIHETYNTEIDVFNRGKLLQEYRNRNLKFIGYLVKEFELKRNAAQFARASISKSGEIDMKKIWGHKLKDDLFLRVTKIPNGKNHGMLMFIDWSGSMENNITNSIEQIIILADFCRKVNIHFEVYAFSNNSSNSKLLNAEFIDNQFSKNLKDIAIPQTLFLLNLLSSQMSKTQYREAQYRLLQLAKIFEVYCEKYQNQIIKSLRTYNVPKNLIMGGTPLNEALIAANSIVKNFKAAYKIDVLSTIVLTDGDGNSTEFFIDDHKLTRFKLTPQFCQGTGANIIIKDKETNMTTVAKPNEMITSGLLRMLQANSDTKLVGYYISERNIKYTSLRISNEYGNSISQEEIIKYIKKNRFYSIKDIGYDEYFIINGKDLAVSEDKIEVGSNQKRELLRAFVKNQKNKVLNRVLLNKFVEQIA